MWETEREREQWRLDELAWQCRCREWSSFNVLIVYWKLDYRGEFRFNETRFHLFTGMKFIVSSRNKFGYNEVGSELYNWSQCHEGNFKKKINKRCWVFWGVMILKRFIFVLLFFIFVKFGFFIFYFFYFCIWRNYWPRSGADANAFSFFWVFCIKILFLTNKFSIIYFVRVIFSCVDISFDKT